jgi:hypothetical protein
MNRARSTFELRSFRRSPQHGGRLVPTVWVSPTVFAGDRHGGFLPCLIPLQKPSTSAGKRNFMGHRIGILALKP